MTFMQIVDNGIVAELMLSKEDQVVTVGIDDKIKAAGCCFTT